MPQYQAPLQDIQFLLHDVYQFADHYQALGFDEVNRELVDAIVTEAAKFTENELAPRRQHFDEAGASLQDGVVTLPEGFKQAYRAYCDNGWCSLSANPDFGGQGLPHSLNTVFHEMAFSANMPWVAITTLTQSAIAALESHAEDDLKNQYLPKMVAGQWSGTMCLTEPHSGSDLGLLRTKAEPQEDGTYQITGNKIFITFGEQDVTENIIHLVLARLPDAPKGPKGISLFLVPKYIPTDDNEPGERNAVTCAAIEKKLGLKVSPTCVLNFDGAQGWLVGPPNKGLACMFTMMNAARLDVGVEGMANGQLAYQGALEYAKDRLQMRAPTGAVAPEQAADPIIHHPDVRRMLLTQKSVVEGCRALSYMVAQFLDQSKYAEGEQQQFADAMMALLTPINKAFNTERGFEMAHLGIQVFGGHGFVSEHGMEQILRDSRISLLYEGTNGIQANDLLFRKVLGNKGAFVEQFVGLIDQFVDPVKGREDMVEFIEPLQQQVDQWQTLTQMLLQRAQENLNDPASVALEYLELTGYVMLAYCWARMAQVALDKASDEAQPSPFLSGKVKTARFYFDRILPRTVGLAEAIQKRSDSMMAFELDEF